MLDSFLGVVVGLILGFGLGWWKYRGNGEGGGKGRDKGKAALFLAALLYGGVASAGEGWYSPVSLVRLGGAETVVSWEVEVDPSIAPKVRRATGLAFGLGYEFANGFAVSAQYLRLHERFAASWLDQPYGAGALAFDNRETRSGLILTGNVPLAPVGRWVRGWFCP